MKTAILHLNKGQVDLLFLVLIFLISSLVLYTPLMKFVYNIEKTNKKLFYLKEIYRISLLVNKTTSYAIINFDKNYHITCLNKEIKLGSYKLKGNWCDCDLNKKEVNISWEGDCIAIH